MKLKLETAFRNVSKWYCKNKLLVNLKKAKLMFFGPSGMLNAMQNVQIMMEDTVIDKIEVFKYLELTLDTQLTFKEHVDYIKRETFSKIHLLGKPSYILDRQTLLQLYKTLILPLFDYGDIVYHGICSREADTLHKLQNAACRSILEVDPRTHIVDMHEDLCLPPLFQRCNHHIANTMHNFYHGSGPPYCEKFVNRTSDCHAVNTRTAEADLLVVPKTKLKITEISFSVTVPKTWNQIPGAIREIESNETFNKEVKTVTFI